MSQFGAIESSTLGDGSAGAIGIVVDRLLMGPGAVIGSSAAGGPDALGGAGTTEITAADSITMAGSPARELAAIGTVNTAAGPGGSVTITTARLHIVRGGISTDSIATGNAGNILVVVTDRLVLDDGSISAEADIAGGGRITIEVGELIDLRGSEIATSVAGDATTTAGDITIDPRFIILDDSRIVAQAEEGRGGNIRITVDNLIQSPDSLISASAGPAGIDGTVVVSTPGLDLSSELVRVEGAVIGDALIREKCASRRDIGASSFTVLGRGGLPPNPGGPLHGTYLAPSDGGGADQRGSTAAPSDSRWLTEASCLDAPMRAAAG